MKRHTKHLTACALGLTLAGVAAIAAAADPTLRRTPDDSFRAHGPLLITGDRAGPPLTPELFDGNESEPFTPEHHVAIIENTHATSNPNLTDDHNNGGLAVVLHSYGDDDITVWDIDQYNPADHILNTINRNDHFITFYRERENGQQDIVGRIEGLSFWDMGEVNQQLVGFLEQQGVGFFEWLELDVTFNHPSTWLEVDPPSLTVTNFTAPTATLGTLPSLAYNNDNCEFSGAPEVCLYLDVPIPGIADPRIEFDLTFNRGARTSVDFGSLADNPLTYLEFDPGSISGTSPIEFGDPFLTTNGDFLNTFVNDLQSVFESTLPTAVQMYVNPMEFAAEHFYALNGGVTYASGSGDYAEYMERLDPQETLMFGDIVGVHGGKISKKTDGADHVLVISYKPIVLGNQPPPEDEALYEKVAFMGQTHVKVTGNVNEGDFIVPSGRGDGLGEAVRPQDMTPELFGQVVGVAWGSGARLTGPHMVNVAVGLRPVEVAQVVQKQDAALKALQSDYAVQQTELNELRSQVTVLRAALDTVDQLAEQVRVLQAALDDRASGPAMAGK